MFRKLFLFVFVVVFCVSCNNSGNSGNTEKTNIEKTTETTIDLPDLAGTYELPADGCNLKLIINKVGNEFNYEFKGMNGIIDMSGNLIYNKEGDTYRLTFDGPIENNKPKTVEAIFQDKSITIQNYGNAEQNFTVFSDCQEKYLEFVRK